MSEIIEIDPATNLPELPHGHHWQVDHRKYRPERTDHSVYFGTKTYPEQTEAYIVKMMRDAGPGRWSRDEWETGYTLEQAELMRARCGDRVKFEEGRKVTTRNWWGKKTVTQTYYRYTWENGEPTEIRGAEISPDNFNESSIRSAAERVLSEHREQECKKNLLGSYPPKKLGA